MQRVQPARDENTIRIRGVVSGLRVTNDDEIIAR